MPPQIRWRQRFDNFQRTLRILERLADASIAELSDVERIGYVKLFELTFELAWKTLKNYLEYAGVDQQLLGSRDTIRTAFRSGLLAAGEPWIAMLRLRNDLTHRYDQLKATDLLHELKASILPLFLALENKLLTLDEEE